LDFKINRCEYQSSSTEKRLEVLNEIVGSTEQGRLATLDRINTYVRRMEMIFVRPSFSRNFNPDDIIRQRGQGNVQTINALPPPNPFVCLMMKYGQNSDVNLSFMDHMVYDKISEKEISEERIMKFESVRNSLAHSMSADTSVFTSTSRNMLSTSIETPHVTKTIEEFQTENVAW
jgi:hypothetical protein